MDYGAGFHEEERSGPRTFRWMQRRAVLGFAPLRRARHLELRVFSPFFDASQTLTLRAFRGGLRAGAAQSFHLLHDDWSFSVPVPAGADRMALETNKIFPREHYPEDSRELSVMVSGALLHSDGARAKHVLRQWGNAALNYGEMLAGKLRLGSTPPVLGIDLNSDCNIKPPCVYCQCEDSRTAAGRFAAVPFDAKTLASYGPFFDNASSLVSCGLGEPFMKRDLGKVLDLLGRRHKRLEVATNAQLLTDANIGKLVGRDIRVYISLDAATARTYARLRNRNFDKVVENVRRLIRAKGGRHRPPEVYMVFMPMRANLAELERFVGLCSELEADLMVLRPLNEGISWTRTRSGYRFDYAKELLSTEELIRLSGRAAELCRRAGVPLSNQLDFGGSLEGRAGKGMVPAAPGGPCAPGAAGSGTVPAAAKPSLGGSKRPLCLEPWRNLYILRRGIPACCYGSSFLARMDGSKDVWNSPAMQSIRASLAQGRLHAYCRSSPSCPIVRRAGLGAGRG